MATIFRRRPTGRPQLFVAAQRLTETNVSLLAAARDAGLRAEWLPMEAIGCRLRPGDTVLSRFDVRPTLDGVEPGIWELRRARHQGVHVLNDTDALLRAHDKLATACCLAASGVPHPRTAHLLAAGRTPPFAPPLVLKPRFGSWGEDVLLCRSDDEYRRRFADIRDRRWFRRHGVLAQELVPPCGYDLRVVVAAGRVVGAVERRAPDDEWRTNVAHGATRAPARLGARAVALALAAARSVRGDLVGVDLLPSAHHDHVVLEVNGAVDVTVDYSLEGRDVFDEAVGALAVSAGLRLHSDAPGQQAARAVEQPARWDPELAS